MNDPWKAWRQQQDPKVLERLGALWGKSKTVDRPQPNLLAQHLFDAAAVGELLWDRFFAPALCDHLDAATDGDGRRFFAWLCAFHDVGKATPAFQHQVDWLAQRVHDAGLACHGLGPHPARKWRHERASAWVLLQATSAVGWADESQAWVWPLVAGHHGVFPSRGDVRPPRRKLHGREAEWTQVQQALADVATLAAGYSDLADAEPSSQPSRAVQLALSGLVIMADWIASDEHHFPGVDDWTQVTPEHARERATRAWDALGLRRGWGRLSTVPSDPIAERFAVEPRASQRAVVQAAHAMPEPGLLVLEAPTGEGKTEAALAAAEVLAARFGNDGVFVGMPTQATSDPMLWRVGTWANHIDEGMQVALLHGKRRFNPEWQALLERRPSHPQHSPSGEPLDEHGLPDVFSAASVVPADIDHGGDSEEALAAVQDWLLGPKRGLLAPTAVGTVDQLLFAATRTKHVALRFAGLAGKVVVLDEVHAADIYMQQFLVEALWWLADAGVPVVLLTATLSPRQRADFVEAYLQGALADASFELGPSPTPDGYPAVTSACVVEQTPSLHSVTAQSWQAGATVRVEVFDNHSRDPHEAVAEHVQTATRDGGCVLVLRNTVDGAQQTYQALSARLPGEVALVHGRLSAADRASRTEQLLAQLGPDRDGSEARPTRLVVVATQVAEQSFDVDVDLLISDLAPVDLLVQRAGRLHRHQRGPADRPPRLAEPRLVVTGLRLHSQGPPDIDAGAVAVYGEANRTHDARGDAALQTPYRGAAPLLKTAALVEAATHDGGWRLPAQVPELVAAAYSTEPITPASWQEAENVEVEAFETLQGRRAHSARQYRLAASRSRSAPTLAGIHGGTERSVDEQELTAAVRDGPPSAEVLLVRRDGERYRSLDGSDLGLQGERILHDAQAREAALGGTVRFPSDEQLTAAAERLGPVLPEFRAHPWTRHANVLVLEEGEAELDGRRVRYDPELGLIVERATHRSPARAGTT